MSLLAAAAPNQHAYSKRTAPAMRHSCNSQPYTRNALHLMQKSDRESTKATWTTLQA